jgi:hypothetical protein
MTILANTAIMVNVPNLSDAVLPNWPDRMLCTLHQRGVFQQLVYFFSSRVPTHLRCFSLVRCATNLVADAEVGSRSLLNFFRRNINIES